MEPIELTDEQREKLPPHELRVIAKDQPQYRPLPAAVFVGGDGLVDGVVTRWVLSPEERARVVAGEDLFVQVLTFGRPLQPILLTIGIEEQVAQAEQYAPRR